MFFIKAKYRIFTENVGVGHIIGMFSILVIKMEHIDANEGIRLMGGQVLKSKEVENYNYLVALEFDTLLMVEKNTAPLMRMLPSQ